MNFKTFPPIFIYNSLVILLIALTIACSYFGPRGLYASIGLGLILVFTLRAMFREKRATAAQSQLELIFSKGTQGIILTRSDGNIIMANPFSEKLFGYSDNDLSETKIELLIPGLTFAGNASYFENFDLQFRKEVWGKRKDNSAFPLEISSNKYTSGTKKYIVTFITDISLRKDNDDKEQQEVQQKIRESEAKYRSFFENSMDGILLTSPTGQIISANPAACEIFQMTQEEICTADRNVLLDTEDPRFPILLGHRKLNRRIKGELTFIRKDGSRFPGEVSSAMFTDGFGEERTAMIIRDITSQKKVKEKLIRISNELQDALNGLNKIMDSSQDIICTFDIEGNFVTVSAASEKILGYKPGELIGKKYIDMVYANDVEKTLAVADGIMSGMVVTMFENRYMHKTGKVVPILWSARWDDVDKVMYCIAKDASEKKRLEKAFETEKQRFYDLFLQAPSCMGILRGPHHVFEMVNPLYLKLTGRKNIIGKTIKETFSELERKSILTLLDKVYSTGEIASGNETLISIDKDGNGSLTDIYVNFIYQPYKNEDGVVEGILFFANDVTEQVLSRRKIEENEKRYRQIIETAQEGIWLTDEKGKTTFVNTKIAQILEYTNEEMIGKELSFFMVDGETQLENKFGQYKKEGYSGRSQLKFISKTGNELWTNISANPLYNEVEDFKGSLIMVTDITEQKFAELERVKLTSDLVKHSKDLEQFAYIVSHNLRAPIVNILGISNVLNGNITDTDREKSQKFLFSAVQQLDTIVKDMNHILQTRLDVIETKEHINLTELIESTKSSLGNLIQKEGAHIVTDFSGVDHITSIRSYMQSIFHNLVSNSIKFKKRDEAPFISIRSEKQKGKIKIIIKDTGTGIDLAENSNKIFGLYKRFHPRIEGKGVGLFMVKTQVEALGGTIQVRSEVMAGTEFTIELPVD